MLQYNSWGHALQGSSHGVQLSHTALGSTFQYFLLWQSLRQMAEGQLDCRDGIWAEIFKAFKLRDCSYQQLVDFVDHLLELTLMTFCCMEVCTSPAGHHFYDILSSLAILVRHICFIQNKRNHITLTVIFWSRCLHRWPINTFCCIRECVFLTWSMQSHLTYCNRQALFWNMHHGACSSLVYNVQNMHSSLSYWYMSIIFFFLSLYHTHTLTHAQFQTVQMRLVTSVDIRPN